MPFLARLPGLQQLLDVLAGIAQRDEVAAVGQHDWLIEASGPRHDSPYRRPATIASAAIDQQHDSSSGFVVHPLGRGT
jgi:hypothetical protein